MRSYLLLLASLLILGACGKDEVLRDDSTPLQEDRGRYDETRYFSEGEKTISLWGTDLQVVEEDSVYVFQGDVRISKRDVEELRGAVHPSQKWSNNTVHYKLSNFSISTDGAASRVHEAIKEIGRKTYLTFLPKVDGDGVSSYIDIVYSPIDTISPQSNSIGRRHKGINRLIIPRGNSSKGTVVHEICHALGMYHEQSRADRDKYINIDFSNIIPRYRTQFKTYRESNEVGQDLGEFDFSSVMMYGSFSSFAIDERKPVMTRKDGSVFYAQRTELSQGDVQALNWLYPAGDIFRFEETLGKSDTYQDKGLEQIRQKELKCPEGASVEFELQYSFTPSAEYYSKGVWGDAFRGFGGGYPGFGGGYPLEPMLPPGDIFQVPLTDGDCDIYLRLELVNQLYRGRDYVHEVKLSDVVRPWKSELWKIDLPKGYYHTRIRLIGTLKTDQDVERKKETLKKILYSTRAFLNIKSASINGVKKRIPSEFKNKDRHATFISL